MLDARRGLLPSNRIEVKMPPRFVDRVVMLGLLGAYEEDSPVGHDRMIRRILRDQIPQVGRNLRLYTIISAYLIMGFAHKSEVLR